MAARETAAEHLSGSELQFCAIYDAMLADLRRAELRAIHGLACRLRALCTAPHALERCAATLRQDRSTLLRFSYMSLIRPEDMETLIALSDARGFPPRPADIIYVAKLPRARRILVLMTRLSARVAEAERRWALRADGRGVHSANPAAVLQPPAADRHVREGG